MLGAIIEDKNNNTTIQIYINKNDNTYELSGFKVQNSKITPVNIDVLNYFKLFTLGKNTENIETYNDYQVILDKDTNLKHYFKNNLEDFSLLFKFNGIDALLYLENTRLDKEKSVLRKIKIRGITFTITEIFLGIALVISVTGAVPSLPIFGERIAITSGISYLMDEYEVDKFSDPITLDMIKDYIYTSPNINNKNVKDFLYNEELLNKVLPCYNNTNLSIISRIRFNNIGIKSFISKDENAVIQAETLGYYSFEHLLHIRDYIENNFDPDSEQASTIAHEYIHLLQTSDCFPFIVEPSAEIICEEFFFNIDNSDISYSYPEAVKYLKILMEIIGPDAVWDNNFRSGSTTIEDAVRPYLSDKDYKDFIIIMNLSPYKDKEILHSKYQRLEELLDTLYFNKYSENIEENSLINAIKSNGSYNRPYFKDSLIENSESYYVILKSVPLSEGIDRGLIHFMKSQETDITGYATSNNLERISVNVICDENVKDSNIKLIGVLVKGTVTLKNGKILPVNKAIEQKLVKVKYFIQKEVSFEEFILNYENNRDYKIVSEPNVGFSLETNTVNTINYVYIPSITEKFAEKENKLS